MLTITRQGGSNLSGGLVDSAWTRAGEERRHEPRLPPGSRGRRPSSHAPDPLAYPPPTHLTQRPTVAMGSMETYHGHVRTPADAIILFEACRLGLLPRVQRRLSEKERQSIQSGSVFVWDEREAGMRRWTDGKSWSASRVSGSFLTYREMEGKRGGSALNSTSAARGKAGKSPGSTKGSDSDVDMADDGPDGYRYKPDGLMKQSFSITTSTSQHLHLISYYSRSHPAAPSLHQPTNDTSLRHIRPQKGMYPESTVHEQQNAPVVNAIAPASYASALPALSGPSSYARPGSSQPHNYAGHQGYAWSSGATGAPPPTYAGAPYTSSPQLAAPNGGSATASPLSYSQTPPPAISGSMLAAYDRASTAQSDSALPPPPPPARRHRDSASSSGSGPLPPYLPHTSPRIAQAALAAQHAAEQGSKIDPRLMALSGSTGDALTPPADYLDGHTSRDTGASASTIPTELEAGVQAAHAP
ncbi:MAG: hypothetical protein M1838_005731 [Thelocarpon superellum]|nr:MAG: hypothetical protein M1838_005731 [Thelocarpon superellum]